MYANGTCLGCPRIDGKPEPKEGDTIRVYGQLGRPFYGIDLNGVEVFWRTPWERFARRVEMLAGFDREHRERFEQNRDAMDRRYDALPAVLKARIDRFRSERADFRIDSEAYEMAAVGDAPKIARALAGREGWKLDDDLRAPGVPKERIEAVIQSFMDENYERQKELVPDLDEGHSGNTFGGAVRLAYALLAGEGVRHGTRASEVRDLPRRRRLPLAAESSERRSGRAIRGVHVGAGRAPRRGGGGARGSVGAGRERGGVLMAFPDIEYDKSDERLAKATIGRPSAWDRIRRDVGIDRDRSLLGSVIGAVIGRALVGATYAAGALFVADLWGVI